MPSALLKPPALKPGATVALLSPANWLAEADIAVASAAFAQQQLAVTNPPSNQLRWHRFAGTDAARAAALNSAFADPTIDAIICTRGGDGSMRLLDLLDYDLIRANPKIFCGYSDITMLLHSLYHRAGLVTFHGPMGVNYLNGVDVFSMSHFLSVVQGETPTIAPPQATAIQTGTATGRLMGGNLTLLTTLLGTPDEFDTTDAILFIEDEKETHHRLDRMLWHLYRAGKLAHIRGLIIGDMTETTDYTDIPYGLTLTATAAELLGPNVPIVANFPCGHGQEAATLPLGLAATLKVAHNEVSLQLLEPAVAG